MRQPPTRRESFEAYQRICHVDFTERYGANYSPNQAHHGFCCGVDWVLSLMGIGELVPKAPSLPLLNETMLGKPLDTPAPKG